MKLARAVVLLAVVSLLVLAGCAIAIGHGRAQFNQTDATSYEGSSNRINRTDVRFK